MNQSERHPRRLRTAAMLVVALSLAACSDPTPTPATTPAPEVAVAEAPASDPAGGSCLTAALGVCQDFTGAGHAPADVRGLCQAQQLVYATTACDDADRLGTCLLFTGEPVESKLHYARTFPPGAEGAKAQCEEKLKGRWEPAPDA